MKRIPIFRNALGWNNKVDPVELAYDAETGSSELAVAYNVDVSRRGRVSRRKGFVKRVDLAGIHSLFSCPFVTLFCAGDGVYKLNEDFSYNLIADGAPEGVRTSYAEVNRVVYAINPGMKIKVVDGVVSAFVREGSYVGPVTIRQYMDPPTGSHIAYYSSRMYIAKDNVLWASDPAAFAWFNKGNGFRQFESRITMLRPVTTGIYVSTENGVWYLYGKTFNEMQQKLVFSYPAVEWSDCYTLFSGLRSPYLMERGFYAECAVWLGRNSEGQTSVCVGGDDGRVVDMTVDKIDAPAGIFAASIIHDDKFIGLIQG